MTAILESLEELTSWESYCAFMKERLKQLPEGECTIFLSKKKLDFNEQGKRWKGRAVLIGPKGELVVKKVKKDGVQFFEGTCRAAGKELSIEGIEKAFLKGAALTLKRLRLGYSIAGVGDTGESDDSPDVSEDGQGAAPGSASAPATTDPDMLARRLQALRVQIDRASAVTTPETEAFLKQARARADEAEALIDSDPAKAAARLQEGEQFGSLAVVGVLEGGDPHEGVRIETARQGLLAELADAKKINDPANKVTLETAEKGLDQALVELGKQDYAKAQALLDAVEAQLGLVVEGPEPADDPDLTMLGDWPKYRAFLKAQRKRIPKEGGPAFVSREAQTFSIAGKEFKGHALLFGPKARAAYVALRREGTLFMEGTCKVDGTTLKLGGIKKSLLKGAGRTMVKLRLGLRIVPDGFLPAEDETSDKAQDGATGNKSLDKQVQAIAESLVKLREAIEKQRKAVPGLEKDAKDKRKRADELVASARKASDAGTDKPKDWDDAAHAVSAADAAQFGAKSAAKEATRAENDLREMTERLQRIRDSAEGASQKQAQLKKLKADVAARQLDASIANIDTSDPKAGKLLAEQIEKRFGVKFKLNESKIQGRDADGNQIFKDNAKKVDPKKEAETLKELYLTMSKAPAFPQSHLKKLVVSLRPADSESEGGVYYEDSKSAEITCRRPKESFDYGKQLNSASAFPDGVDPDCRASNNDPVNYFDWATLHEVAHAVDAKHKFMDGRKAQPKYGAWIEYQSNVGPIATLVADHFGKSLSAPDKKKLEAYANKLLKAKPGAGAAPTTPEETSVKGWVDGVRVTKGLWWDGGQSAALAIGNRVYQEGYENWWNSYDLGARKQGIHGYQFRAPGEWFAELYAAYYSDKLKPSHPIVADMARLEAPK